MEPRPMMDRLEAVFSIVPKAQSIADIGTDHGYLAVELINRQRAEYVIAGDVHKGPLESARSYVESCGLADKVVDAGPEPLEFYVLQPQNGQKELRQYMVQKGYVIVLEIIVEDAGKLYTAFLAVRNDCVEAYTGMTEYVDIYQSLPADSLLWSVGALLEQDRPPLWMKYIEYLIYQRQCALDDMTEKLNHTDKYQDLEQEVNFLSNLLENK
ncbi:MAG: class I SAM-dependent methyltransferase [Veillonella sp.]|nr:class I SAM-dependent methyltransferase [Veillonella sp.]